MFSRLKNTLMQQIDTQGRRIIGVHPELNCLLYGRKGHSTTFGGSGTGKTVSNVMPTIISQIVDPSTAIMVADSKQGELASQLLPLCRLYGRTPYLIDPTKVLEKRGIHEKRSEVNPFGSAVDVYQNNPEELIHELPNTTEPLIPMAQGDEQNKFWYEMPQGLLQQGLHMNLEREPQGCTPGGLATLFRNEELFLKLTKIDAEEGSPLLQSMCQNTLMRKEDVPEHHTQFMNRATKSLLSYMPGTALHDFGFTADTTYQEMLEPGAITFLVGEQRYIKEQGSFYMSIINSFVQTILGDRASGRAKRICINIDEATNTPIANLIERLTVLRSKGVEVHLTSQSLSEWERKFSKTITRTMLDNTDTKIWMGFNDPEQAKKVSGEIGDELAYTQTISRSSDAISNQQSVRTNRQKIMSASKLMSLPDNQFLYLMRGVGFGVGTKIRQNEIAPFAYDLASNPEEGGRLEPDIKFTIKTPRRKETA